MCADCILMCCTVLFERWQAAQDWAFCCLRWKRRKVEEGDREALISIFHNDAERREFICAGAAAGIAVSRLSDVLEFQGLRDLAAQTIMLRI